METIYTSKHWCQSIKLRGVIAGFDEIPGVLVKYCSHYTAKPLTHVFNLSFEFGDFPDLMKAKISPLFKKGDKQDIQNYRPIAVLPVFSKILEKIMYNRLLSFLKKFNILTDEENGFRNNKSTITACHTFIENIQHASTYMRLEYFLILPKHTML
jgi:hypothetical protein